jgi:hypothetical protein
MDAAKHDNLAPLMDALIKISSLKLHQNRNN